jgi:carbonic anhydrase
MSVTPAGCSSNAALARGNERFRSGKNAAFVDEVARTNVLQTVDQIRSQSSVLADLEHSGKIRIVGSMYHLRGGRLEVLT